MIGPNSKSQTLVGGSEMFNYLLYVIFQWSKKYTNRVLSVALPYTPLPLWRKLLPSSNQRNLNLNSRGYSSLSSQSSHIRPYYNVQKYIPPNLNYPRWRKWWRLIVHGGPWDSMPKISPPIREVK